MFAAWVYLASIVAKQIYENQPTSMNHSIALSASLHLQISFKLTMKSRIIIFLVLSAAHLFSIIDLAHLCGLWLHGNHRRLLFICLGTTSIFALLLLYIGISVLILFLSHLFILFFDESSSLPTLF